MLGFIPLLIVCTILIINHFIDLYKSYNQIEKILSKNITEEIPDSNKTSNRDELNFSTRVIRSTPLSSTELIEKWNKLNH